MRDSQGEQFPRRQWHVPPDHHYSSNYVVNNFGRLRISRSLASDYSAKKPPRAVNTHKSDVPGGIRSISLDRNPRRDLWTERTLVLTQRTTLALYLTDNLFANSVPEPTGSGRGEGLELDSRSRVFEGYSDNTIVALINIEPQLCSPLRLDP